MVSHLCHVVGVSRQEYHAYFSKRRIQIRQEREAKDMVLRDLVLKSFHFKKRKKGARQIKMVLSDHFGVSMNLKCIQRIMGKYNIVCPIRKAAPYKRLIKATAEHRVVPNHLKREFKQGTPCNAVQESFFGHFKDIIKLEACTTFDSLRNEGRRAKLLQSPSLLMEHEQDNSCTEQESSPSSRISFFQMSFT